MRKYLDWNGKEWYFLDAHSLIVKSMVPNKKEQMRCPSKKWKLNCPLRDHTHHP